METFKQAMERISADRIMRQASNPGKEMCGECSQFFLPEQLDKSSTCAACRDLEEKKKEEEYIKKREEAWVRQCPKAFQQTEINRLPCQEAVRRALDWKCGEKGLLLHGPTGTGKTRTAWLVLRNAYLKMKRFKVLNSMAALEYASLYSQSAERVEDWAREIMTVELLFLDDIFKNKLTDSFEGMIFSIIDRRTESCRPIIMSSNDTGATIANRMTSDRGEPLVRRLREFCTSIAFNP